jgi:Family of unknown function (DUF5683)
MLINLKKILSMFLLPALLVILSFTASGQNTETLLQADSSKTITATVDTTAPANKKVKKINVYSPRKAALRSAILPGWGQIYNKKYWKLPIVYGALGVTAAIFIYNLKNYQNTRFAYKAKYNASLPGATAADSAELLKIKPELQPLSIQSLQYYRDSFRKDIDYSAVFFLIFWGLNVVDAAVDSHLKAFDVSPDLSLHLKAGYSEMAGTNGLSIVLNIGR